MSQPPYITDRIRFFRSKKLDKKEESTISNVEKFGWEVVMIDGGSRNWAFTVGLHDTQGKPELIVIGLNSEVAHRVLNDVAQSQIDGVDLSKGRHKDVLEGVDVEFRPVDKKWLRQVMGWATWYNCGDDFPVLQLIFPDKENRFPEDDGFNERYAQVMLQPGAPMTRLENDFWAENDPKSSLFDWKFPDPPHTTVYLSQAVQSGLEEVNFVSHESSDGAWQFLGDSMIREDEKPVVSCFHHPIDKDPSLKELSDLPLGWYAVRDNPASPWERFEIPPDEEQS